MVPVLVSVPGTVSQRRPSSSGRWRSRVSPARLRRQGQEGDRQPVAVADGALQGGARLLFGFRHQPDAERDQLVGRPQAQHLAAAVPGQQAQARHMPAQEPDIQVGACGEGEPHELVQPGDHRLRRVDQHQRIGIGPDQSGRQAFGRTDLGIETTSHS